MNIHLDINRNLTNIENITTALPFELFLSAFFFPCMSAFWSFPLSLLTSLSLHKVPRSVSGNTTDVQVFLQASTWVKLSTRVGSKTLEACNRDERWWMSNWRWKMSGIHCGDSFHHISLNQNKHGMRLWGLFLL